MLPVAALGASETDRARIRSLVERAQITDAGALSAGPAAIQGTVRKHRQSVAEPLGDGECVFARYQRIRQTGDRTGDAGETVERTAETVPFVVEDDTGRVLVDLRDVVQSDGDPVIASAGNTDRYVGDEGGETLVDVPEDRDEDVERLATARSTLGESPGWIHVQSTIRPGDRVYVFGNVEETPGGSPPHVISPDADETVVVSDMSQSALLEQLQPVSGGIDRRFWAFAVLGAIVVVILVVAVGVFVDSFLI